MKNKDATERFRQADRLFREGRYKEALYILNLLDESFPNDRHILWPKAMCLARLGRTDEAVNLLQYIIDEFDYPRAKEALNQLRSQQHGPSASTATEPIAFGEHSDDSNDMGFTPTDLDTLKLDGGNDILTPVNKAAIKPASPPTREFPWAIVAGVVAVAIVIAAVVLLVMSAGREKDPAATAQGPAAIQEGPAEEVATGSAIEPTEPTEPFPGASADFLVVPQPEWSDEQLVAWYESQHEWTAEQWDEWDAIENSMSDTEYERFSIAYDRAENAYYGDAFSDFESEFAWMDTLWGRILFGLVTSYLWQWLPIFLTLLLSGNLPGDTWGARLLEVSQVTLYVAILSITCLGYILAIIMLGRKYEWGLGEYAIYVVFSAISLAAWVGLAIFLGVAIVASTVGMG